MRAGVLGTVSGDFRYVDSYSDTVETAGEELDRYMDVHRVFSLPDGQWAFAGVAAREVRRTDDVATIGDDGVTVNSETRTETVHTEFAGVAGEFVVVASSKGTFAFDLLGMEADVAVERATVDLDSVYETTADARAWRAGVAGDGDGVSGVFHGQDLRERNDLEQLRSEGTLSQLGLEYDYDGDALKMTATRSGYVEVYQPSSFGTEAYLTYLADEISPTLVS